MMRRKRKVLVGIALSGVLLTARDGDDDLRAMMKASTRCINGQNTPWLQGHWPIGENIQTARNVSRWFVPPN